MSEKREIKCAECPECGCAEFAHPDYLGYGYRICTNCRQEWCTTINYKKYCSSAYYFEVFTQMGREIPATDRKGDTNHFDKRSVKRRIRKLVKDGWSVTAFVSKPGKPRAMIFSNYEPNAMNAIGLKTTEARQ